MRIICEEFERDRVEMVARSYGLRTVGRATRYLVRDIEAKHRRILENEERAEQVRRSLNAAEAERYQRVLRRTA